MVVRRFENPDIDSDLFAISPSIFLNSFSIENVMDQLNNINSLKEKNNMKSKVILDLYFNNMKAAVKEKTENTIDALTSTDPIVSAIQQKVCEIRKIIDDNMHSIASKDASFDVKIDDLMSKETEASIEKIYEERETEINRLNMLKNEIMTMLTPCETYDEELDILFAYGIIDDDGKLIHPDANDGNKEA